MHLLPTITDITTQANDLMSHNWDMIKKFREPLKQKCQSKAGSYTMVFHKTIQFALNIALSILLSFL